MDTGAVCGGTLPHHWQQNNPSNAQLFLQELKISVVERSPDTLKLYHPDPYIYNRISVLIG